jgi:uncharacterized surface protein with fasciclin (FAS1) repeats
MIRTRFARAAAVTATLALAVTMTACSSDDDSNDTASSTDTKASASPTPAMAAQFGPACAGVPTDASNPGSFEGMAKDPVATAASHNDALKTLVAAVTAAGLGDTLNNAKDITVFAPTNDAFAKIPKADLDKVLADKATLTKILTYHVVGKRVTPAELGTAGPYATLEGGMVPVAGSGEDFTVGKDAKVVCGNIQTANATVYIIDSVLMPTA